jgi:polyvinyl alcohol dehydrogenase (cytochrome)
MFVLDAATGRTLWSFDSGGPVVSGPAVVGGTVYWGSGFNLASRCPNGSGAIQACRTSNDKFFAFRLGS